MDGTGVGVDGVGAAVGVGRCVTVGAMVGAEEGNPLRNLVGTADGISLSLSAEVGSLVIFCREGEKVGAFDSLCRVGTEVGRIVLRCVGATDGLVVTPVGSTVFIFTVGVEEGKEDLSL